MTPNTSKVFAVLIAFPTAAIAVVFGGAIDPSVLTDKGSTATVTGMLATVLIASLFHFRAENKRTDHNRDQSVVDARQEAEDARDQRDSEREQHRVELNYRDRERDRYEAEREAWAVERTRLINERDEAARQRDAAQKGPTS